MLIDVIFVILMLIACIKGYRKGFIIAIFSFVALIIGLAAALKLSAIVANHLQNSIHVSAKWLPFISFILVFFVVVLLVKWGGKLIEKTFETIMLGWANRLGGIILYAVIYTIILSIFLFYIEKINLLKLSTIQESRCYVYIKPLGPKAINWFGRFIPVFKDMFTQLENFFSTLPQKI
jgi:membrane protein required for colicin V production